MFTTPVVPMIRRFGAAARREGLVPATGRASRYAMRRLRGIGAGGLSLTGRMRAQGPSLYMNGVWQSLARSDAFHIGEPPAYHRKRRHIAMVADLNLPQCRKYRVEQLAAFWRARDVEFEFAHYQDIPRAVRIMQHATHLMEYRLQSGPVADMLRYEARRLRLPILYDIDDPLFSVSAYETYRNMEALDATTKAHFLREAPKYLAMMNGADIISVSTPGMQSHAALYCTRPIFVRRNFADPQTLDAGMAAMKVPMRGDGVFRVAFASGSQGHEVDLAETVEALGMFLAERKDRRLLLLGHFDLSRLPPAIRGRAEIVKFGAYDRYLTALARADCAIMPLCDDAFNRCKSAVRVIDAAAVGLPALVGEVGDLPRMVRHGETGLIAPKAGGWLAALRLLADNRTRARRMGRAARATLETEWRASEAPHIIAPELLNWIRE